MGHFFSTMQKRVLSTSSFSAARALAVLVLAPHLLSAQVTPPNGPGWALQLDGINDYAFVPDSPALRFGNQFTIEFWFKPDSLAQGPKYLLARSSVDASKQAAVIFG